MEDKYKHQKNYDAKHSKMISIKLIDTSDKDIIEWLSHQESRQGAIKKAIREYMSK